MSKEKGRSRFEDQAQASRIELERRGAARSAEMQMVHDNLDGNLTRMQQVELNHEVFSRQKSQKKSTGVGNARNATAAELRAHAEKIRQNAT